MTTATLAETTVGELVVERPARARVFEQLGIDYCCGGRVPLADACRHEGLDVSAVLAALERDPLQAAPDQRDWAAASLTELCDHIEAVHHASLRRELPRLQELAARVVDRHGPHEPRLAQIYRVLLGLKAELESHLLKEEQILFPLCRQLDGATQLPAMHCGHLGNPIAVMFREHDAAGAALAQLRELTDDYAAPSHACNSYRALFDGLRELELDLHQHIHKENNILFPRAIAAEQALREE